MLSDLHHTLRRLFKEPGRFLIITLILGLAIGATTTISSVVNGVLLQPLPFPSPERLYTLWQRAPGVGVEEDWFSIAQYFDIRQQATCFEESAILYGRNLTLTGDGLEPERRGGLEASSSFFDLLGISPSLGRRLEPADDLAGSGRKALLSERLFAERYGARGDLIGRSITIDGEAVEVVGVLPEMTLDSDLIPTLATIPVFDVILSLPTEDPQKTTNGSENYNIIARSRSGFSEEQIEASLLTVAADFVKQGGSLGTGLEAGTEYRIGFVPLIEQIVGGVRLPLLVLLAATLLLLVIACANVANLLLTAAAARRREFGVRSALGAGRSRILVSAMTESVLLALIGGGLGLAIAVVGVRTIHWMSPERLPRLDDVAIDTAVLLIAAALCLLSSVLCGLGPALKASAIPPIEILRESAGRGSSRSLWQGGGGSLVILQVALSVVLACGATLTIRTYQQLKSIDPGFEPDGVLSFRISLVGERYRQREARLQFFETLHDQLRGLPSVEEVGGTSMLPLTRGFAWTDFLVEGWSTLQPTKSDRMVADVHHVTAGYFESMGVPLLAGRFFERLDGHGPEVVMVNRSFVERFWSPEEALGKWIARVARDKMRIVGVVDDIRHYGLDAQPRPAVYYPYPRRGSRTLYTTLQTGVDPDTLAPSVAAAIRRVDPLLPVYDVRSMLGRVGDSLAPQRLTMTLLNLFSGIALVLAVVGLYGVLSFTVASQTREIGIRRALGARHRDLYRLVFGRAALVTGVGLAMGLVAALLSLRGVEGLVWGISTSDPPSLIFAIALVSLVAFLASLLPARRSAAVNPLEALRED